MPSGQMQPEFKGQSILMVEKATPVRIDQSVSTSTNKALNALPVAERAVLMAALKRCDVSARQKLDEGCVWFPESAVVSVVIGADRARSIEVGMIGREALLKTDLAQQGRLDLQALVLVAGTMLQMEAADFMGLSKHYPALADMARQAEAGLAYQFALSALSHGTGTIDARIARWILMVHDRVESDTIPVVHNLIADMLAVRRSGVTTALHILEGVGAIKSVRGLIIVRDRDVLKRLAGDAYQPDFSR